MKGALTGESVRYHTRVLLRHSCSELSKQKYAKHFTFHQFWLSLVRMRTIELIKNRSDIGAGTRGSDMGIDALEIAAINKGSRFFPDHPHVDVKTRNASVYVQDVNPFGKHIKQIFAQCSDVAAAVQKSLTQNHFPLIISGDHSSAIGTIGGIKSAFPDKTLGVIWMDAHADIHSPFTTPSGNLHGMPLAAVLGEDN